MYTQCPKCQTVFRITMEQLQAHSGVVRCGECDHVFNADQQLFDDFPEKNAAKPTAAPKKARAPASNKSKPTKSKAVTASATAAHKPARPAKKPHQQKVVEEVEAAPAPWTAPGEPGTAKDPEFAPTYAVRAPEIERHSLRAPRRFSFLWIVGSLLLLVAFAAQSAYFYRDRLSAYPELRPYLIEICAELGCTLRPPYDVGRIELVQPTNIAPHPRMANALRLRATLVNRAGKPQAHPLMQITLTDSNGRVLARRTFASNQYLEQRATSATEMPPHLAVSALLDLTNPDGKAVGYQIDFLPPPIL
jgi:predicted Zn finger-like uncharacterized protein